MGVSRQEVGVSGEKWRFLGDKQEVTTPKPIAAKYFRHVTRCG